MRSFTGLPTNATMNKYNKSCAMSYKVSSPGKYSCIAKNCMGEAQSMAELTLEDIKAHLNEEEKEQLLATNIPPR